MTDIHAGDANGDPAWTPLRFDPMVPSPARMWNYWVGGKDHFAADRAAGDAVTEAMPSLPEVARSVRAFLGCIVNNLASWP